jgi:hypothetical protein
LHKKTKDVLSIFCAGNPLLTSTVVSLLTPVTCNRRIRGQISLAQPISSKESMVNSIFHVASEFNGIEIGGGPIKRQFLEQDKPFIS